jgi:hypothetical protein
MRRILKDDYKLRKRGDWWDLHTELQAATLDALQDQGYVAQFAVGCDQAVEYITSYLSALRGTVKPLEPLLNQGKELGKQAGYRSEEEVADDITAERRKREPWRDAAQAHDVPDSNLQF